MHLQTLTVKGFKSFASTTTLRFEPGITAVVGPNGSGKSNVVDAIAWVLGEQGAKALRGGKMEDVIFAGTAGRPPLGRAEVTLTIDNHDGALPIDYAEVSITRRMFRDGASEYEINGSSARLLDIQELLSDSGIGREMHVIVGQGQLDSVLQARPEDRRGFIEEAAGVLKHRKRKEKALRKLDAMAANLTRVTDLTTELRRQLGPLGRQAEAARRAAGVQADLRDARLRMLADDLVHLGAALDRDAAGGQAVRDHRATVEARVAGVRARIAGLEADLGASAPQLTNAQEAWVSLSNLAERVSSTISLAAQRARHLRTEPDAPTLGPDPQTLDAEADRVAARQRALEAELATGRAALAAAVDIRTARETALSEAEAALRAAARAMADRREGLARLTGQVNALRARASAATEEIARLTGAAENARDRAARTAAEQERVQAEAGDLDVGEVGLDERHAATEQNYARIEARRQELIDTWRAAERDVSTWSARRDALALGLTRKDGAGALLGAGGPELLGSVPALLAVEPGWEAAVTAALGPVADAVAVGSAAAAARALELLREQDAGRAGLLIAGGPAVPTASLPVLPPGARWAIDLVTPAAVVRSAVHATLAGVICVDDLPGAAAAVARHPGLRAVTRAGDLVEAFFAHGGSPAAPTALEMQAAADEATREAGAAGGRVQAAKTELDLVTGRSAAARAEVEAALRALHRSDAALAAVAATLAELGAKARSAQAEADRLDEAARAAEQARDRELVGLADLEVRLDAATTVVDVRPAAEPDPGPRDAAAAAAEVARATEIETRLTLRTAEERARAGQGRADALRRQAESERTARARREAARVTREHDAVIAAAVRDAAGELAGLVGAARERALTARDRLAALRAGGEAELAQARLAARIDEDALTALTGEVHSGEVARAEQRLRLSELRRRAIDELGVEPEALLAEYGPDQLVPPSGAELSDYQVEVAKGRDVAAPAPVPFDRPTQARRLARAEDELAKLGRVNPLALEEYAALEERHQFLSTQLEDLKNTRRDLLMVIREVDDRILDVFTSAYHDVAREFEVVFSVLFPGGEGRLVLTDPDDMLATGIEVEARPPGKKVKRLSLLSGGERSLTAVALLVAIFRARPSPFYIMDEVEAALDDVNLGRLLTLIAELRDTSQLILITHQKRSMEIADALYGVTMRGDGISQVISQRLRAPDSNGPPSDSAAVGTEADEASRTVTV